MNYKAMMITKTENKQVAPPTTRWPWQRSLQNRIIITYGAVFLVVLGLLLVRAGQIIYSSQLEEAEHNLEVESFLAANALEDPLSGYAAEFEAYARWELEQEHEEAAESPESNDENESEHEKAPVVSAPTQPDQIVQRLQQVAAVYASDTEARVTIIDPQGHVVADSAYPFVAVGNQLDKIEVQAALRAEEQHDVRPDPFTGVLTLYAAAPIQQGKQILGVVRLARPMSAVTAKIWSLLFNLAAAGLLALLLATGLGIWISRHLVKPVRELEQAALAIAKGDLSQQVAVTTADELGSLASAFNFMADELRRMLEQQRLFVANASHELRTPLTNIKLRSEALLNVGKDDPTITERYLTEIDSEADRLGRLASTLLDLSRLEDRSATERSPEENVDISPILLSVARAMRLRTNRRGLTLRATIPEELPPIRVWPDQVEAVVINLMDNAIKYTPEGGEIRLDAQAADGWCQIRIQDTGPGIPEEDLPYIFDRFYRVDKTRSRRTGKDGIGSGAGLGLSIVKTLVEQNGGRIQAESIPGQGTTFVVEFPVASATTRES
jgi:signal transduction histidine kinase